jgi:hypothetical protein
MRRNNADVACVVDARCRGAQGSSTSASATGTRCVGAAAFVHRESRQSKQPALTPPVLLWARQLFLDGPPTSAEEAHRVRAAALLSFLICCSDATSSVALTGVSICFCSQGLVRAYGSLEAALAAAQRA